jgi:hypothetical protein
MKTRSKRDALQTSQCIYSIPCECGRSYIGETGRPIAVRLREHRRNLQEDLLVKSKLVQHAYEEGQRVGWDDARVLEIESNSRYRKYKELAQYCVLNQPDQPTRSGHFSSLDPRLPEHKDVPYDLKSLPRLLQGFSLECSVVSQQMSLAVVIVRVHIFFNHY